MGSGFGFRVSGSLKAGLLVCSVALIVFATLLPFGGMTAERIPPAWCLRCGTLWLTDAIANVALFVPFGFAVALQRASRRSLRTAAMAALLFSTVIECLQYAGLPPGRSPALADIITNTVGGVGGALLYTMLVQERSRTARAAGWLAISWTVLAAIVFTLTARALQQVAASDEPRPGLQKSPFGHAPGHGWYEGVTDSAAVNDTVIRRGWSGPVILAARADVLPASASVWVRSTDPLGGQIPLLFVHQQRDSSAWLQIAKSGNDAELTVMRTAWTWGLTMPTVIVPDVFRGRTPSDSSTVALSARVTSATLALQHGSRTSTLRLTPLLGWSLIQPLFTVQSAFSSLAQLSWVWLWAFPIGWWGRRSTRPLAITAGLGVLTVGWLAVLPLLFGLASLSAGEWAVTVAGIGAGVIVAQLMRSFRSDDRPERVESSGFGSSASLPETS